MTVQEYIERLQALLAATKDPNNPASVALTLSVEELNTLYEAKTVEEAVLFTKSFGKQSLSQYADTAADPSYNLGSNVDPSISVADRQFGTGVTQPLYIGVTDEYEPPQGGKEFYTEEDLFNFANTSVEQIADIQSKLVNANLLQLGTFLPGDWDKPTRDAFRNILGRANRLGVTAAAKQSGLRWKSILDYRARNPVSVPKIEPIYLPPDYDSVQQQVKGLFRQQLNRDPKGYEMKLLGDLLLRESKKAFDQQQMLQQDIEFDVTGTELLEGTYGNHISPDVPEGLEQVSPSAALYEKFEQITKKERERLGTQGDIQATNRIIVNSITGAPR